MKYVSVELVGSMIKLGDKTKEFPENLLQHTSWLGSAEFFDGTRTVPNFERYPSQKEWIIEYLSKGYIIDTVIEHEDQQLIK